MQQLFLDGKKGTSHKEKAPFYMPVPIKIRAFIIYHQFNKTKQELEEIC
jgi:hypothetical protein